MSRATLNILAVLLLAFVPPALGSDSIPTLEQRQADARKILEEAFSHLDDIQNSNERNSAMQAIGLAFIEAGDEARARQIDKKTQTSETPRPILKAIALDQFNKGQLDDAIVTAHIMKDEDAADLTFMALAEQADKLGDPEMAARLCNRVTGTLRLDALLLAARIQAAAADEDGSAASMNAAKLLAVRQPAVAKVAETEALLGNLDRAERLLGRLRREHDRARVYAAMVYIDAAAKDFQSASAHADEIYDDELRSVSIGRIAMARAEIGQVKEAAEAINAISDWDARLSYSRSLVTLELNLHGIQASHQIAATMGDSAKALCLSQVALAAARAGDAKQAQAALDEAKAELAKPHTYMPDETMAMIVENMSQMSRPDDAIEVAGHIRDRAQRGEALSHVISTTARLSGLPAAKKLMDSIADPLGREFGLIGLAEGMVGEGENVTR
jgi:hypothetical protein